MSCSLERAPTQRCREYRSLGVGTVRHSRQKPSGVVRSALMRLTQSTLSLLARLGELANVLPGILKRNMAPKTSRNSGDKGEGARVAQMGKDKGDTAVVGRRPTLMEAKSS
ncbi:hypothetical protein NDU88_006525 [Pleurodeles waltl]|uniref:Uncharacterized protein n=1 Tax=Pleurodeles waltl TaxID=8319 RepID=A0AAV7WGM1_PLEWA|nr:hypothetical protein NDU88_006525 [Pleurodeles waltl]